jgi:hypothetical protein
VRGAGDFCALEQRSQRITLKVHIDDTRLTATVNGTEP